MCANIFLSCEVQVQGATWRSTARGEGQVKGSGMNASRLRPRNPKMLGGVMDGPHGAPIDKEA